VRLGEVELEHDVEACRPGQLECALEQPGGGPIVAPRERAAAGGCEALAGTFGQPRVGLPDLLSVAGGLLEVVAEDLVEILLLLPSVLQPGCDAIVMLVGRRLPLREVGRVP
jgi:hypothetical protein